MKEEWKRQRDGSKATIGFIVWEGTIPIAKLQSQLRCPSTDK
jgi:hypothetical protein